MRILFLATNPSRREASTRYRVEQYFGALRAAGHEPMLSTFFAEERPRARARMYLDGFARRLRDVARATDYDVVVVHRELLPLAWNLPVATITPRVPVVFDFDDAVFLPSPTGKGWRQRLARPASTRALVDASTRVFAGNEYLAAWARETNERVDVIPTVVDTDTYRPRETVEADRIPLVGWIGSPSTAPYLTPLLPTLDELGRSFPFRLLVVGAGMPIRLRNVEVLSPAWSADTEAEQFRSLDIGVYPLADDRWALGKCGFKAIQYMASGVPSVVSPVGVVADIVRPGVDGLWARRLPEWREGVATLLGSPDLRHEMGRAARARAVATWSLAAVAPRFIGALETTAASRA